MIKHSGYAVLVWSVFACGAAMADGEYAICGEPILSGLTVIEAHCDASRGVSAFSYVGPDSTSPYATAFDRRRIVIAKATSASKLKLAGRLLAENHSRVAGGSLLIAPPVEDQILRWERIQTAVKKRGWQVVTQRVTYGAQGGANGFAIDCTTATSWRKTFALAVSECYPLEERQRFIETLAQLPQASD